MVSPQRVNMVDAMADRNGDMYLFRKYNMRTVWCFL